MFLTPDQISAAAKSSADTFSSFALAQIAFIEKLTALNIDAAKTALASSVQQTKALLDARGVQDLANVASASTQPNIEKFVAYTRSVYEVTSQTQAELGELLKAQATEVSKQTASSIDTLAKSGLPGSDTAAAAMKSALSASQTAYDSFDKASKQAKDFVEASVNAAAAKASA